MNLLADIAERVFAANAIFEEPEKAAYLNSLRPFLKELRLSYRSRDIRVDYGNPKVQEAYLLAYFPHHFEIIEKICSESMNGNANPLKVACFGGGPLPELLGLTMSLDNSTRSVEVSLFDKFADQWKYSHDLLEKVFERAGGNEISVSIHRFPFDLRNENNVFRQTPIEIRSSLFDADLVVFQNFLSETDRNNSVQTNILHMFNHWATKPNSLIAFIDLQGYEIENLLEDLAQSLSDYGIAQFPDGVKRGGMRSRETPDELIGTHFFENRDYLRARSFVSFCNLVGIRK